MNSYKKKRMYIIAVVVSLLMVVVTGIMAMLDMLTFIEVLWQVDWSLAMGLFFWNLLRLEVTRSARVVHRSRWTW